MHSWLKLMALACAFLAGSTMAIEEAKYTVELSDDRFELRAYAPQVVAEVVVDDDFQDAGNAAFRPLFRYISGNNTGAEEIAMTAPVAQRTAGEKIAMTTPVGQRATESGWAVSFMMPAEYTIDTLPRPSDERVRLREIPAHHMASVRYSGRWTDSNYQEHLAELKAWVEARGLVITGEPVWARYNGPFTPWFLRRNEILLPVAPPTTT